VLVVVDVYVGGVVFLQEQYCLGSLFSLLYHG
jgi:hypothetical protein